MQTDTSLETNISTVYSISDLNQMVANLLTDCFLPLWVQGEISNFAAPRSGHWYFSLKDKDSQVRCVFFHAQSRTKSLSPREGLQVVALARIRLYEARGDFQLVIEQMETTGEGQLRQAFDLLKTKLAKEGLFDVTRKRLLPRFPNTIGVITSPTGAVIRDIVTVLKRRFPAISILIYPSLVQGEAAADQIVQQIHLANSRVECDILVLARGGGSLEDLWPFNEERVARTIYGSVLPIVSAIGHESDITISDLVADVRAPTPSVAAELISPHQIEWQQVLNEMKQRVWRSVSLSLQQAKQQLNLLKNRVRHPGERLQSFYQHLDELDQRLLRAWQQRLYYQKQRLMGLMQALEMISPFATLARGYALVKRHPGEEMVVTTQQVSPGEVVVVQFSKGKLKCVVEEVLCTD